jgi:hypothetical protein
LRASIFVFPLALTLYCYHPIACTAETLFGGLEHSERLEPIKENIRAGQSFEDKKASTSGDDGDWFKIPKWLAGDWMTVDEVQIDSYDDKSGATDSSATKLTSRQKEKFGWQTDNRGDIWTTKNPLKLLEGTEDKMPSLNATVGKSNNPESKIEQTPVTLRVLVLRQNQPVKINQDKVQFKSTDTIIRIDKRSAQIVSAEKAEIIRQILPLDTNLVAVSSDVQYYDEAGFPIRRVKIASILKRTGNFANTDEFGGRNLQASFSKYLQNSGNIGLMPSK